MAIKKSPNLETVEGQTPVSFLFDGLITCGATLSAFELCQAIRKYRDCYIVSPHNNKELETYFGINPIRKPQGITITFTPKLKGDYSYIRTQDYRWLNHKNKIAVSKYISDWIKADTIIGNGTHHRFKNLNLPRDIDVLISGNNEPNKNIDATIKEAKGKVVWFGRQTKPIPGIEVIEHPRIEEIPILYNRAKTFLSMSKNEGWGRTVAEAKACGCKVINKNGGNKEIKIVKWSEIAKQLENFLKNS